MTPKLSICIPTYNRGAFLGATLDSIMNQATRDVEIVVSDNASDDDTIAVVERYRKGCPAVVYFRHSENVGADCNYLKAVELAAGKYCWLFGSDDIMKNGAIGRILEEIALDLDLYLCNLTLCRFDMSAICDHQVLDTNSDATFNLSDPQERRAYFEKAITTTAFFSFIGSIIVKKDKWDRSQPKQDFIGTLWSHVAKVLGMIPTGLSVKFIKDSLLYKRGDNDSFMDQGLVNRYCVAVDGFNRLGAVFFGNDSVEAFHLRRAVRNELSLRHLLNAKLLCSQTRNFEELATLNRIAAVHYADPDFRNRLSLMAYRLTTPALYRIAKAIKRLARV